MLALFQDEAIVTGSNAETRYADAGKHSTKWGFASANALAGSFSPPVDWPAQLVEAVARATTAKPTFVLWSASKEFSG
jgi:hypothetical protein